jgi:hypothetical protein
VHPLTSPFVIYYWLNIHFVNESCTAMSVLQMIAKMEADMSKQITADGYAPNTFLAHYLSKVFWVVVLVWLGVLIGTARDQGMSGAAAPESAAPSQAVTEDWHGNVRRSGGS